MTGTGLFRTGGGLLRACCAALALFAAVHGEEAAAPYPVQAALFVKLLAFHNGLSGDVTVYVVADDGFRAEMAKGVGKPVGKATLKAVEGGADLPAAVPSAIYVSSEAKTAAVTAYCRKNKILSMTGATALVSAGISLGVGVSGDKPTVLLNPAASKEEGVDWNPAIMKIAQIVK